MKIKILVRSATVILLLVCIEVFPQYEVKSKYLLNPELNFGFVDSCATFWLKSYDETLGGFYTNVNRQGSVTGTKKNMLTQSRNAYGMARAFMLTGNQQYLVKAKDALNFMYNSAWDKTYGGWFGQIDKNGIPTSLGENKTAFDQHYALLGILAYFEASGDTSAWNWFTKGFLNNQEKLWDSDEVLFGYYDYVNYNWYSKNGKSFNATVDAATTHLINAYLLTNDDVYKENLLAVADNIVNRLASTMDSYKIGFVEKFASDWTWNDNSANDNTRTIMGHVLKAAWVLGRIHQVLPNNNYLQTAEKLIGDVIENGYDHMYGGPFKDYDRVTGNMYFYGQDTAKAWWQMEQAIVAGLELYHLTKNDLYLEIADESLDFFMRYFVDHTYGEIYADVFSNGSLIPAWGTTKGGDYKAGYHSIETGYYAYLYGSLFYHNIPVDLYYYYEPVDYNREIVLAPIAINIPLRIKEVLFEEEQYSHFIPETTILKIDANIGGKFKVTIEAIAPVSIVSTKTIENKFELQQNYPNPFNPTTQIKFSLPHAGSASLIIYNLLGEEISTLTNKYLNAGIHTYTFDASKLGSGLYFYSLTFGNTISTKKMIVIK